jgi:hypothetical protein
VIECPGCKRRIPDGALFCPTCRYLLRPIAPGRAAEPDEGPRAEDREAPRRATAGTLDVGATLRAAFAMWGAARGPLMWLAAIGLLASIPVSVLAAATGFDPFSASSYTPLAVLGMALAVLLGLPFSIGSAAGSLIVLAELTRGGATRANPFAAFVRGCLLFKRVLGAWTAMVAVAAVLATPAGIAWFGMDGAAPLRTPVSVALAALAALVGAILWIRWAPTTAVLVLEGKGSLEAIFRAASLTRGRFFRVLGVLAALGLVSFAAQIVTAFFGSAPEIAQVVAMVLDVVLVGPLSAAIAFALYLGLARA